MKSRRKFFSKAGFGAVAAAGVLLFAACTGPAGVQGENKNDDGGSTAAGVDTPPLKIAMIHHSPSGDTFWDIVRKGAEAASAKDNVELLFNNDEDGARQAQLVEQAIDQKVDGIVVTLAKPEALEGAVKKAIAAGIPVFSMNSGEDQYAEMGVLAHFGQNETVAGEAAGEKLNELGAQKVVCVIQEQGHIGLESRCGGVEQTFGGAYEVLYVDGADPTNVASTITSKLQTNSDIDYVLTLGAPIAAIAEKSIAEAGSSSKLATFDMNAAVIDAIQGGTLEFAIDQQPYLQGYGTVDAVWLYLTNRNVFGGGQAVLTGPAIITADNVDDVAEFAKNGTR